VAGDGPVLSRAGAVVTAYFEYLLANPDLPQLMMQELVLSGEPPAPVAGPMKRVVAVLSALIAEGQGRGEVRAGPVVALAVFILSVPVHVSMMRRALSRIGDLDIGDGETFGVVVEAARQFVESGLRAEAGP
jgi:hypothetical protein